MFCLVVWYDRPIIVGFYNIVKMVGSIVTRTCMAVYAIMERKIREVVAKQNAK